MIDTQQIPENRQNKRNQNFSDSLATAKSVDILSVCAALGVEIERTGKTLRWAEHKSLVLYPETNRFYWFSQELGGDVITLVQTITEKTFKEAVVYLNQADFNLAETNNIKQEQEKPSFRYYVQDAEDTTLARDYLINERKINEDIVNRLFQEGYLKQGTYMPGYPENKEPQPCLVARWERHGDLVGGTIQGLIYDEELYGKRGRDKRIMAHSERNFGWNYTIGQPNKIIFAESFIDLLSYWSLHPDLDNCLLVDMEGLKENTVREFLKELVVEKKGSVDEGIIMAVDNDVAGQRFIDKLSKYKFSERDNYVIAQPENHAVLMKHAVIYSRVGKQLGVADEAIATVHKAFTNAENTTQLSNDWKNDQFFGKNLSPKEQPESIDLLKECEKAALALREVQRGVNKYDFMSLALLAGDTPENQSMGHKMMRIYQMYQVEGMVIRKEIQKDWNDMLQKSKEPFPQPLVFQSKVGKEIIQHSDTSVYEERFEIPEKNKQLEFWSRILQLKDFSAFELRQGNTMFILAPSTKHSNQWQLTKFVGGTPISHSHYAKEDLLDPSSDGFDYFYSHLNVGKDAHVIIKKEREVMPTKQKRTTQKIEMEAKKMSVENDKVLAERKEQINKLYEGDLASKQRGLLQTYDDETYEIAEELVSMSRLSEFEQKTIIELTNNTEQIHQFLEVVQAFSDEVKNNVLNIQVTEDEKQVQLQQLWGEIYQKSHPSEMYEFIPEEWRGIDFSPNEIVEFGIPVFQLGGNYLLQLESNTLKRADNTIFFYGHDEEVGQNRILATFEHLSVDEARGLMEAPFEESLHGIDFYFHLDDEKHQKLVDGFQEAIDVIDLNHEGQAIKESIAAYFGRSIGEPEIEVSTEVARELIRTDQEAFEAEGYPVRNNESLERVTQVFRRNFIFFSLYNAVNQADVGRKSDRDLLATIMAYEKPVTACVEMMKDQEISFDDFQLYQEGIPDAFVKYVKEHPERVSPEQVISEKVQESVDLMIESIHQEVEALVDREPTPLQKIRIEALLNQMKQEMVAAGLLTENNDSLIPSEQIQQMEDSNKLVQLGYAFVANQNKSVTEIATVISELHDRFVPKARLIEKTESQIEAFQHWAKNYDSIGKEYVPVDEILDLEVTVENKLLLEAVGAWFDSLEDYLISHKGSNFHHSAAYQNAQVFIRKIDLPERDVIVLDDKVNEFRKRFLEEKGHQVPVETRHLFDNTVVLWGKEEEEGWQLAYSTDPPKDELDVWQSVIQIKHPDGQQEIIESFADFQEMVEKTNQAALLKAEQETQRKALTQELDTLKKWLEQYEGLDQEYIPATEINSLDVVMNSSEDYVIQENVEGGFLREYGNVPAYLSSFDGNVWQESVSFRSAQNYFEHRENEAYLVYEILYQNFAAKKEHILAEAKENNQESAYAKIWQQLFIEEYDAAKKQPLDKLIYYQEPTRTANPIYLENLEAAEKFAKQAIEPTHERSPKDEKPKLNFFRRERKAKEHENESSAQVPSSKSTERNVELYDGLFENKITANTFFDEKLLDAAKPKTPIQTMERKAGKTTEELLKQAKEGAREFLDSEKYKQYLETMSKFHGYSWGNILLIVMQKPDASLVAGFQSWKKNFERHVKKGEKGIRILAPVIKKFEVEKEVQDKKRTEEEKKIVAFRPATVFDVSQTDGKELPVLAHEMEGDILNYAQMFEAIAQTTDYAISFEEIKGDAKGVCNITNKTITLQKGMSEAQTIRTLVHEVTHSQMHDFTLADEKSKDLRTIEVEAESTAFVVCSHFGLDTSEYSFAYLAVWSSGKEIEEITKSFSRIQKQADKMIQTISGNLQELSKEQNQEKTVSKKMELARNLSSRINDIKKPMGKSELQNQTKEQKEK